MCVRVYVCCMCVCVCARACVRVRVCVCVCVAWKNEVYHAYNMHEICMMAMHVSCMECA